MLEWIKSKFKRKPKLPKLVLPYTEFNGTPDDKLPPRVLSARLRAEKEYQEKLARDEL